MRRWALLLSMLGALGACAGGQTIARVFDTQWQDDAGKSIASVEQRLRNYRIPEGANVAVGVTRDGLSAVVLDTGKQWHFEHRFNARPWIAGGVVVGTGDGMVFALDAPTGELLWSRHAGGRIRGAGDDGHTTVVSLSPSLGAGGMLLAIARDGRVVRQLEVDVAAGTPAAVANLAFIPWQNQYVTVYDLLSGSEVARVTLRHQTSHALVSGGSLYFGEFGLTRFDDKIGGASRSKANYITLPNRDLPGEPRWFRHGGVQRSVNADANDRIALYAKPEDRSGSLAIHDDTYYATYYRVVVGLEAATGQMRWAQPVNEDVLAADAFDGGLAACGQQGTVWLLGGPNGQTIQQYAMGREIDSCVVQADTLKRKAASSSEPLVAQLARVVGLNDTQLVTMQQHLLRELAQQSDPAATQVLIELAAEGRVSPVLLPEVHQAIALRRNGADHMLRALERRFNYLEGVLETPPLAPLSQALAAMKEVRAAPLLADHLLDPATSTEDMRHVAAALEVLAGQAEADKLRTFFSLYRATATDADVAESVVRVAGALLRIDAKHSRQLIAAATTDPLTTLPVRTRLTRLAEAQSTGHGSAQIVAGHD